MAARIDAVVIGAGHNGLVAATYLAKAHKKVVVLERAERTGGILRGSEPAPGFRAPGLVHTVGRLRASVVKDLKLDRFGFEPIAPDVRVHAPMPDGSSVTFWGDAARTAEELRTRSAHDADAYVGFDAKVRAIASFLAYVQVAIPPDPASPSLADAIMGLKLGKAFRDLGARTGREAIRALPMAVADLAQEASSKRRCAAAPTRGVHGDGRMGDGDRAGAPERLGWHGMGAPLEPRVPAWAAPTAPRTRSRPRPQASASRSAWGLQAVATRTRATRAIGPALPMHPA